MGPFADNSRVSVTLSYANVARWIECRSAYSRDPARVPCAESTNDDQHAHKITDQAHLFAVAKFDVSLDNATVIHHCRWLAPLPHRTVIFFSLPRTIAPYGRAFAARHHLQDPVDRLRTALRRAVASSLFFFLFFLFTEADGDLQRWARITRQNPYCERSTPSTFHLDSLSACYAH